MRIAVIAAVALATALPMPAQNPARIYVYAQRDTAARSWLPISCNSVVVAELKRGRFFAINVEPGPYTLFVEEGLPLSVDARSGEDSFVRLDWDYGIDRPPIPVLSKVYKDGAQREMKYLTYVDARRVHSNQVPKADPGGRLQPQLRKR